MELATKSVGKMKNIKQRISNVNKIIEAHGVKNISI